MLFKVWCSNLLCPVLSVFLYLLYCYAILCMTLDLPCQNRYVCSLTYHYYIKQIGTNCFITFQSAEARVENSIDTMKYLCWTIWKLPCLKLIKPLCKNWEIYQNPKLYLTPKVLSWCITSESTMVLSLPLTLQIIKDYLGWPQGRVVTFS